MYQRCTQIQNNIITITFIGFAQSNIHVNHVLSSAKIHPPPQKKSKGKIKRKKEKKCQKRQTNTLSNNSIRYTCSQHFLEHTQIECNFMYIHVDLPLNDKYFVLFASVLREKWFYIFELLLQNNPLAALCYLYSFSSTFSMYCSLYKVDL